MLSGYWIYLGGVLLGLLALILLVVAIGGAVLEFTAARHAAVAVAGIRCAGSHRAGAATTH